LGGRPARERGGRRKKGEKSWFEPEEKVSLTKLREKKRSVRGGAHRKKRSLKTWSKDEKKRGKVDEGGLRGLGKTSPNNKEKIVRGGHKGGAGKCPPDGEIGLIRWGGKNRISGRYILHQTATRDGGEKNA